MSEQPRVVLALSPLAEREVETLLFDTRGPLALLASVVEADELQRTIEEHQPDAVLLSPSLSGLGAAHCERIRAQGVRLVGLALDQRDRDDLRALGTDATLDCTATREELLAALLSPTVQQPRPPAAPPPTTAKRGDKRRGGSVLAVIGAKGRPGSSECAASLAALANTRWSTVLVELDALDSGLDLRLGADPTKGSIIGLLRATQTSDGPVAELMERWLIQREGWPAVLPGAPDPPTLYELAQPGAVSNALTALTSVYPLVVCDVGFLLADAQHPAAHVHREALLAADAVLLVLGAGEVQLRDGLRQLDVISEQLRIPSEQLRIAAAGIGAPWCANRTAVRRTVTERLAEHELTVDAWLPWDTRGLKRAQRNGTPLAPARRRGAYARAIDHLLGELFLPTASRPPHAKRRKRRLTEPHPQRSGHEPEEVALPWQT